MYQYDDPTAVAALPAPAAPGSPGFFTDGNPASGAAATILRADFMNMLMLELINLVEASGQTLNKTAYNQVLLAIKRLVQSQVVLTDTGVANAYAAANTPALVGGASATWVNGVVQQILVGNTNNGPSTYAPDGLPPIPIYGLGLQPLQGNEMFAGGTAALMKQTIAGVNGGNPICVLLRCAGGAQQIPPATQPEHAVQGAQIVGRNKIINGRFRVNLRQYASGTVLAASGTYGLDRWKSSTANSSMTYISASQGQQVTIVGSFQQIVEQTNVPPGTYTLSWSGTAQGRVYNSGSSAPAYGSSPVTVTLDGTANVVVEFNAGTLDKVQLENSPFPTSFEYTILADDLARCYRYCEPIVFAFNGNTVSGNAYGGSFNFHVTKRGAPTYTAPTQNNLNGTFASATVQPINGGVDGGLWYATASSSTNGAMYTIASLATCEL